MVALYHELVRRQLAGWSADLSPLGERAPITVEAQPLAPLYEGVWEAIRAGDAGIRFTANCALISPLL